MTPLRRSVALVLALLLLASLVVAALGVTGGLPGADGSPDVAPSTSAPLDPSPSAAPDVLAAEPTSAGAGLPLAPVAALDRLLASGALGPDPGAAVLDVGTETVLVDRSAYRPRTPASVAKLVTGAAALLTLDPASRLRTRVVAQEPVDAAEPGAGREPVEVVLVGGGDSTLATKPSPEGTYPPRADLAALADATVTALSGSGTATVAVIVDDRLFQGPAESPDWPAGYVASGVVSPVSALAVDAGRSRAGADRRVADPALAAGRSLARMLRQLGLEVAGEVTRGAAAPTAVELAAVSSPTVAELVELMLSESDNDLAESLLRLVAVGQGRPGTFVEGTDGAVSALAGIGVPAAGAVLLDGSGLARGSALAPATLAGLLVRASDGSTPRLGPLVTGLPVAGFTGTLALRFDTGRAAAVAGLVRAKTGTLTGVSTLAGVTSLSGRPVAFAVMADRVPGDTLAARDALDRFAANLTRS